MPLIKNTSRGTRTFQVRDKNRVRTVFLDPGQEADLDVVDTKDPVFAAMVESKEIRVGKSSRRKDDDDGDEGQDGTGASGTGDLSDPAIQKASEQNPKQLADREAATNAGGVRGVVDAASATVKAEADKKAK